MRKDWTTSLFPAASKPAPLMMQVDLQESMHLTMEQHTDLAQDHETWTSSGGSCGPRAASGQQGEPTDPSCHV